MTTRIVPQVGRRMRQALMASVTAPDVLKLLEAVKAPSPELSAIIKQLVKMVEAKPQAAGVKPPSLEGIYKSLKGLKGEKDKSVGAAIKLLDKIYGKKNGSTAAPGSSQSSLGNLPFFELMRSAPAVGDKSQQPALQAAIGKGPGHYNARLIRAGEALDKKKWRSDALQAAVNKGLFEGTPLKVFSYAGEYGPVEYHLPLTDSDFAGTTVGNQVGFVTNASWNAAEEAVYGDLVVTDPQRQALIDAMIDKGVNLPGLSIYCEGDMDELMDIHAISKIHSMDLVTWPAADGAILGVQALQASWLGFLGAADEMRPAPQVPAATAQEEATGPVEGADPTSNESVGEISWKTERNVQLDFFTSLANSARETIEAGGEVVPGNVSQLYDKWRPAWEGSQDETFEAFMSEFWGNPENASLLKKQEQVEEPPQAQEPQPAKPEEGQGVQTTLDLEPKKVAGASRAGGSRLEINGRRVRDIENRLGSIEGRVKVVDSEAMLDQKLASSGLPRDMRQAIREDIQGRVISASAMDGLIDSHRRAISSLEAGLAQEAAISIEGQPLDGGSNAAEAMSIILHRT